MMFSKQKLFFIRISVLLLFSLFLSFCIKSPKTSSPPYDGPNYKEWFTSISTFNLLGNEILDTIKPNIKGFSKNLTFQVGKSVLIKSVKNTRSIISKDNPATLTVYNKDTNEVVYEDTNFINNFWRNSLINTFTPSSAIKNEGSYRIVYSIPVSDSDENVLLEFFVDTVGE